MTERLDFLSTWLSPRVSGISQWPTARPLPVQIKLTLNPIPYYSFLIYWEIRIISKAGHTFFTSSGFSKRISQEIECTYGCRVMPFLWVIVSSHDDTSLIFLPFLHHHSPLPTFMNFPIYLLHMKCYSRSSHWICLFYPKWTICW